jgi:hypothetical protein
VIVMTRKQRDLLNLLIAERAYLVRSHQRRAYLLIRRPRAGRSKEVTLAVFNALRPHLDSRAVRPGEPLPDGDGWKNGPATIWKAAG